MKNIRKIAEIQLLPAISPKHRIDRQYVSL
jgi:hypothetical protein